MQLFQLWGIYLTPRSADLRGLDKAMTIAKIRPDVEMKVSASNVSGYGGSYTEIGLNS